MTKVGQAVPFRLPRHFGQAVLAPAAKLVEK